MPLSAEARTVEMIVPVPPIVWHKQCKNHLAVSPSSTPIFLYRPWSFHLLGHVTLQPAGVLQLAGSLQSSGALQSSEVLRTGCLYKSSHLALFPFCFLHQLFTTTLPPHPLLSSLSIFSLGPHLFYPFYLYLLKRFRILN